MAGLGSSVDHVRRIFWSSVLVAGFGLLALLSQTAAAARDYQTGSVAVEHQGPPDGLVLIIRHAEKSDSGAGLAPAGQRRADAYVSYFQRLRVGGSAVHIDTLVATADSARSDRPRLTLAPLSRALRLSIQQPFADRDVKALTRWLALQPPHRTILVAWHHGRIPELLGELGADPPDLLPGGGWPGDRYDWVVALRYGATGRLVKAERIVEPGDLANDIG